MRWLAIIMLVACRSNDPAPPPAPPPSPPPVADAALDAALDAPAIDAHIVDRCAEACLYLRDTPLADAPKIYQAACAKPWPYTGLDCRALLYARNCIYAAFGNVFKRAEWKQKFEHAAWYVPDPAFREDAFTDVARANVAALVKASRTCADTLPEVSQADIDLVIKTFDTLKTGKSVGAISGAKVAVDWEGWFITDHTLVTYEDSSDTERHIGILGLQHGAKFEENASIVFVFDRKNRLIDSSADPQR